MILVAITGPPLESTWAPGAPETATEPPSELIMRVPLMAVAVTGPPPESTCAPRAPAVSEPPS